MSPLHPLLAAALEDARRLPLALSRACRICPCAECGQPAREGSIYCDSCDMQEGNEP